MKSEDIEPITFTLPTEDGEEEVVLDDEGITIGSREISLQDMYICYATIKYMTNQDVSGEALEKILELFTSKVTERIEEAQDA